MSRPEPHQAPHDDADLLDASGRHLPPTPLRDRSPFSRGARIGYGVAVALFVLIPVLLLWGDHAWDSCRAEGGETDLCGLAMVLAGFAAIVVGAVGLIVAGITAWQRARRLRRERGPSGLTDA